MEDLDRDARLLELLKDQMNRLEVRFADRLKASEAIIRLLILGLAAISIVLSQSAGENFRALRAFMPCVGLLGLAMQAVLLYHLTGFSRTSREMRNTERAIFRIIEDRTLTTEIDHWMGRGVSRRIGRGADRRAGSGARLAGLMAGGRARAGAVVLFALVQVGFFLGVEIALRNGVAERDEATPVLLQGLDLVELARGQGLAAYTAVVLITAIILCAGSLVAFLSLLKEVSLSSQGE